MEEGLLHFTSSKTGWGGDGRCRFTGDSPEVFSDYRKELADSLGLGEEQFVFPRQTHSDHVALVTGPMTGTEIPNTDALITNVPGLCLCVQTADCVPILIYDPVWRVVAAIHAGWRGTVERIVEKTVNCMEEVFQCNPQDFFAGIGPSISSANYEVGSEVVQAVRDNFRSHKGLLRPSVNDGGAFLDLWKANQSLLIELGLRGENIEIMSLCSFEEKEKFFSARREGAQTGRMVTGIMLL